MNKKILCVKSKNCHEQMSQNYVLHQYAEFQKRICNNKEKTKIRIWSL